MDTTVVVVIIPAVTAIITLLLNSIIDRIKRKSIHREEREDKVPFICNEISDIKGKCAERQEDIVFCKTADHLLLKWKVIELTDKAEEKGYISKETMGFIKSAVDLLHANGENGDMTACLDRAKVIEQISLKNKQVENKEE